LWPRNSPEDEGLFFWIVIIVASVLLIQAVAQYLCIQLDARKFPVPGSLVKTTRCTMHVRQMGNGKPALVLEAGIAASSLNWSILQPQLAELTSAYSYDRAGFGWSPSSGGQCTLQRLSSDLHDLVTALNLPKPYILIGHSFGAYIVRVYAQRFPEELAGVILVDPLTPEEWTSPTPAQRWQLRRGMWFSRAGAVLGSLGVIRFCLWLLQRGNSAAPRSVLGAFGSKASETVRRILGELSKLPPQTMRLIRERWSNGKFFWTMARYIQSLPACAIEASSCEIPAHIPVTVISGAHQPGVRMAEHRAIADHSVQGKHIIAAKSAHWVHLDQPELIVESFREMAALKPLTTKDTKEHRGKT
jgi:pimeloyl-ACP methyl ester carboxylesterase